MGGGFSTPYDHSTGFDGGAAQLWQGRHQGGEPKLRGGGDACHTAVYANLLLDPGEDALVVATATT